MKPLLISCLLLSAAPLLPAQQNGIEQDSELITVPAGDKFLRWYGYEGRSYFLQVSDANDPLGKWNWAPIIEGGTDEEISYEVDGTAAKAFFRLKYISMVPGANQTLESADFDNDGITNWNEITTHSTDPLIPDTDGDGFLDGQESSAGTSPINPASFPLKVVGSTPKFGPLHSTAVGHPADKSVILYLNQSLPGSVTSINSPWIYQWNNGIATPVSGATTILPGRKALAFVPAGNSFLAWPEEDESPPYYTITFNQEKTGLLHLIPFERGFYTSAISVDHGPWIGKALPSSEFIDVGLNATIKVAWSEPLDPTTVIPANLSLISPGGNPISVTLGFDYGKDVNLLQITPTETLSPSTRYTVALGTGFKNLTGEAHAQPVSWEFTTRPLRPVYTGPAPHVVSVSPADFSFGIVPPESIAITFSEDMDSSTLTSAQVHLRAGNGLDLPGSYNYTNYNRTLIFLPDTPFFPFTYFSLELDLDEIKSLPATGNPAFLQGNGSIAFATGTPTGGSTTTSDAGVKSPAAIAPLQLHYTWGRVASFDGNGNPNGALPYIPRSGCSIDIKLIDKDGGEILKTLPADLDAVQVQDSGAIAPATTVVVTPVFVMGLDGDPEEECKKNGIYILPTDSVPPPGMTYLVFRKTPAAYDGSEPENVEFLGPFGPKVGARCADSYGNGPQSLYFVPVPVQRDLPGDSSVVFNLIENDLSKALPGQQIKLKLEDKYLNNYGPGNVSLPVSSMVWTLPDKTFKEYDPNNTASNYTNLVPSELAGAQEIKYYWKDSGEKEPKVDLQVKVYNSIAGAANSKAKIRVDKIESKFDIVVGEERVDMAANRNGDIVSMFGLFSETAGDVIPGVKFVGSAKTPPGWPVGEWAWVQVIKSKRKYTYVGGVKTQLGDGSSFKLDTKWPYSRNFPSNGDVATGIDCADTPRDALKGRPSAVAPLTDRERIEVHEVFETYLMFRPPGGLFSRYIPLKKASWKWGGVATSADGWSAVVAPESSTSDTSSVETTDHPIWSANSDSEQQIPDP